MLILSVLYEDDILLVCNKPAGLMVEPDRNNFPNLQQQVKEYLKKSTGAKNPYAQHLHRLDRPVSGVVLFTKDKLYLNTLSNQFAERKVKKYYRAITNNCPLEITAILEQWHRKEKKKAILVPEGTLFAEKIKLQYAVKAAESDFVWDIELHTGKFHQIRLQLSELGCPIVGDFLYGSEVAYKPNAIALHAKRLEIGHPVTNKHLVFETDEMLYSNH